MNNKVKVALTLATGGALVFLALKNRKNGKAKLFTAPDGNTYKENQLYRTFDNKLFKNGKQISFDTPNPEPIDNKQFSQAEHDFQNANLNQQPINQQVNYHNKGSRHQ